MTAQALQRRRASGDQREASWIDPQPVFESRERVSPPPFFERDPCQHVAQLRIIRSVSDERFSDGCRL